MFKQALAFIGKRVASGACIALGLFGTAYALTSLQRDLTATGIDQPTLVDFLGNVVTKVNAIDASVDSNVTLATELRTDHGTNKTTIDESRTAIIELIDDHATYKSAVNDLVARVNQILVSDAFANTVLANDATGTAGLAGPSVAVDGVNPENVQFDNGIFYRVNGQTFYKGVDAEVDLSAECTGAGDTISTSGSGTLWLFVNPAGTVDCDTANGTTENEASAIATLAQYSVATNTVPVGSDDVAVGVIQVTEGGSGAFTWGTDSITDETETYYSLQGLPGVETAMASFALDVGTPTFTYGAATVRLGTGARVALTGKANVTITGSNVADGNTGVWLFYALADDDELAVQLSAAEADLATAQATVRDHTPNPLLPLIGVIYVENASGVDFVPNTTNLDANNITATFTTLGPGTNQVEVGRDALGQPFSALTNDAPATLAATDPTASAAGLSASAPTAVSDTDDLTLSRP